MTISTFDQQFSNSNQLIDFFFNLKNVVPGRNEKRHKERQYKKEIYCLENYLIALNHKNKLSFPIEVAKAESPDFILNGDIGLEVTEATHNEYQQWLNQTRSSKPLKTHGDYGYLGNNPEVNCFRYIIERCEKKFKKLSQYYENNPQMKECNLLIYENLELPALDAEYILSLAKKYPDWLYYNFQHISVITGRNLLYSINTVFAEVIEIPAY